MSHVTTRHVKRIAIVALAVVACGSPPAAVDGGADASAPDAAEPWEHRTINLRSGLSVDAWGPRAKLDGLPQSPSAPEFCEEFELSVVVTFDSVPVPVSYAAAGSFRAAPRPCGPSADLTCPPRSYFLQHLLPDLTEFQVPDPEQQPIGAGFYGHPLGISVFPVEYRAEGSPFITGLFDKRTSAPVAAFLHDGGDLEYRPSTWQTADGAAPYAGGPTWSRMIDFPFSACMDPAMVIPQAMRLYFNADLASCGIVFALAFPLERADVTYEDLVWCPAVPTGFGVALLATTEDHPFITTECPRPVEAGYEWLCFTQ